MRCGWLLALKMSFWLMTVIVSSHRVRWFILWDITSSTVYLSPVDPSKHEVFRSNNSLAPQEPYRISLRGASSLVPEDSMEVSLFLHADRIGPQHLCLLFVFREVHRHFDPVAMLG